MSKALTVLASGFALVASTYALASAQVLPEVIVHQSDTIQWVVGSPSPPHKVRFGANGATSVADINDILENITPPLTAGDGPQASSGILLTARVKDDATPGKTFIFTCGVHPVAMLSLPFTVAAKVVGQPSRTHKIMGEAGLHWHVHVDTTP
jgi:hypothetical protein